MRVTACPALRIGLAPLVFSLGTSLLFSSGCGREATAEDCDRIVKRITELELGGTVRSEDLGSEIAQAQRSLHDQALARCVGKRITQSALDCVATATTADQIVNQCFD
jgi:hypothetical protein